MGRDPIKNLQWNKGGRPPTSNKLGAPNPRSGSDGDIQIKQTALGARIFGKVGGRWYNTPLALDDKVRFGTAQADQLVIDNDSVDIFKNNIKVASFGETTTVGNLNASSDTGIITVTSIQCAGLIKVGKADGTFNTTDNINIGQLNSGEGVYNVFVGYRAGEDSELATSLNIGIGYLSLKDVNGLALGNTCVGAESGEAITTGAQNTCIGYQADAVNNGTNQTAIGYGTVTDSSNDINLGNTSVDEIKGQVAFGTYSDERTKTSIQDGDLGLNFINLLKPRKFKKVNPAEYPESIKREMDGVNMIWTDSQANKVWDGLIAQEVKSAIDSCNTTFSGWNEETNSKQLIMYSTLTMPLIKAVQELSAKIDTMQTEINNLKAE